MSHSGHHLLPTFFALSITGTKLIESPAFKVITNCPLEVEDSLNGQAVLLFTTLLMAKDMPSVLAA